MPFVVIRHNGFPAHQSWPSGSSALIAAASKAGRSPRSPSLGGARKYRPSRFDGEPLFPQKIYGKFTGEKRRGTAVSECRSGPKCRFSPHRPAGREMGVGGIVTGHFLKEGDQLQVTLEAVDVNTNRLLWRDTLDVPSENMITMQRQVIATAREGLAPALGSTSFTTDTAARPQN